MSATVGSPTLPRCKYGTACYRQNPQHIRDFDHSQPPVDDNDNTSSGVAPSNDSSEEDNDDDDEDETRSRTVRSGRSKSTALASVDDDDDDSDGTTKRRRSTAVRSSATDTTKKRSTKKTTRRASNSPAGRRRSRAPLAAAAAAIVAAPAVVPPPVVPLPDAAVPEEHLVFARFQVNKPVLKRLAHFGLLWLFVVACVWFHFHYFANWLRDCEGDLLFDCATGNGGQYVPLHENGGSCAVLTDLPRWRAKACRDLWWVTEGQIHPRINCRELCNCNAQAPMYGIIVTVLAMCWMVDILAAVFTPGVRVSNAEATARGIGPMVRCIVLGTFDFMTLVTVTSVPTASTGGLRFASILLIVLHFSCAFVLIPSASQEKPPVAASKTRRRRRSPTSHHLRHDEEAAAMVITAPVLIACFVAFTSMVDSDIGFRRRLWSMFTTWQLGGESWMYLAVSIQTAILTFYVHRSWKKARNEPEEPEE